MFELLVKHAPPHILFCDNQQYSKPAFILIICREIYKVKPVLSCELEKSHRFPHTLYSPVILNISLLVTKGVDFFLTPTTFSIFCRYQLGILHCNTILTPSTQRWLQVLQVKGSILQDCLTLTSDANCKSRLSPVLLTD